MSGETSKKSSYVLQLSPQQAEYLQRLLTQKNGWIRKEIPYTNFAFQGQGVQCAYYPKSQRLVIQGKGTEDFIKYIIEPEVTGEARLGYELVWAQQEHPEMFQDHAGMDESGKGDIFGPLVTACCFITEATASALFTEGIRDCKKVHSDQQLLELEKICRRILGPQAIKVITITNETYNRMYQEMNNINHLLAWAHGKTLSLLLQKIPQCKVAILDQFTHQTSLIFRYLPRSLSCEVVQRVRAEEDIAVAAASVCARATFIRRLQKLSSDYQMEFPKGAGQITHKVLEQFIQRYGVLLLPKVAKCHFQPVQSYINRTSENQEFPLEGLKDGDQGVNTLDH